jgi:cytochrome c peroxidase
MNVSLLCRFAGVLGTLATLGSLVAPDAQRTSPQVSYERGEDLFFHETYGGNGRVCATCHDPRNEFTISPDLVRDRWRRDTAHPLFRAVDSDDGQGTGYVRLLTHAQFRVRIPLADNVFLPAAPTERSILVFRGVPTLANAELTAPYGVDGRFDSRQNQALAAIADHMQPTAQPRSRELDSIAAFVGEAFYPLRLRALRAESGDTLPLDPDFSIPLVSSAAIRGKGLFDANCARCHSGELRNRPLDHHQPLFSSVEVSERNRTGLPLLRLGFRKSDGTVVFAETPDPGRGALTGELTDLNAFEIPSLRGIRHTAPYFHDNSAPTLKELVEHYNEVLELGLTPEELDDLVSYLEVL